MSYVSSLVTPVSK